MLANEVIERNQQMFIELHAISSRIKTMFVPLGRPGRVPKLFTQL